MVSKLMFRLLQIQILLAAVGAVNGFVSSFFANNFVGIETMSAVGLYGTINALVLALSTMLVAGSTILCGKYLGQNAKEKLQNVFSVNLLAAGAIGLLFALLFILCAVFDLMGCMISAGKEGSMKSVPTSRRFPWRKWPETSSCTGLRKTERLTALTCGSFTKTIV